MLELERCQGTVGSLVPCWLQKPAQRYNIPISISAIDVCSHLQWVNGSIELALGFSFPGGIGDRAVLLRGR